MHTAGANPLGFVSCKGRTKRLPYISCDLNDERPLMAALCIGWAEVFCVEKMLFLIELRFADLAATYSPAS